MARRTKYVATLAVAVAVLYVFLAPSTTLPDTVKSQTSAAFSIILAVFLLMSLAAVFTREHIQVCPSFAVSDLFVKERVLRI